MVDPSAGLKVLPLSFSARLLKITLALHRFNDSILGQQPVSVEGKALVMFIIHLNKVVDIGQIDNH